MGKKSATGGAGEAKPAAARGPAVDSAVPLARAEASRPLRSGVPSVRGGGGGGGGGEGLWLLQLLFLFLCFFYCCFAWFACV